MATQGPNSGTTFVSVAPGITWIDPSLAGSSDDSRATVSLPIFDDESEHLKGTDFGFSIPSGATIDGIVVELERSADAADAVGETEAKMVKGGTIGGNNNSDGSFLPTSEAYKTYGSSSDLWGLAWTPADINAINFGFAFRCANGIVLLRNAFVDHIRITVYYTLSNHLMLLGVGP
jgi:hypothetical protein